MRKRLGSVGLLAALVVTALVWILPRGNSVVEWWFWKGYPAYVLPLSSLADEVPVSLSATFLPALLAWLVFSFLRSWRLGKARGERRRALLRTTFTAAGVAGWMWLLLFLPWFALHRRAPIEERLGYAELEDEPTLTRELRAAYDELLASLGGERPPFEPAGIESAVDRALLENLGSHFPEGARPGRIKALPSGVLMAFGVSGVFLPGFAEPHVDPGLPPRRAPFVLAHEKLHRMGITSEGEANFLAFLALSAADRSELRYAALLTLHPYVLVAERRTGAGEGIPAWVHEDWLAAREVHRAAEISALRSLQQQANDAYLRMAGDRGGLRSYGEFALLVGRQRRSHRPGDR